MRKILWEQLKRTEFKQFADADAVVIIPVGAMEQHGNHLPVNTDTNCTYTLAKCAAEAVEGIPVLVLPPVWAGYSPHHMSMEHPEGTISLGYHTFANLLTDIAASVHAHGFRRVMFLNGHGGNTAIVASIRLKLLEEKGIPSIYGFTYWELPDMAGAMRDISETDRGFIGHASEFETSLQLLLQPDLVDMEVAEWDTGVAGNPASASREKGKLMFDATVNSLVGVIRRYHAGEYEDARIWRKTI